MTDLKGQQQQAFQDRLKRISKQDRKKAAIVTPGVVSHPGPDREKVPLGSFLIAGLVGTVAMLGGNVLAFQLGQFGAGANVFEKVGAQIGQIGLAGLFLLVVMIGFGMRDKPHVIALAIVLPLTYFGEPYLAYTFPEIWVQMYSGDHVETMLIQAGLRMPPLAGGS